MGDDPLYPPNTTADGQTFRDWIDFVDRVARPLVEAEHVTDEQAAMALYEKASPYFICVALLMAYNRAHPEPIRFDPDDRDTWPEWGQEVVARFNARWSAVGFIAGGDCQVWEERSGTGRTSYTAAAGDLWQPLPSTEEGGAE